MRPFLISTTDPEVLSHHTVRILDDVVAKAPDIQYPNIIGIGEPCHGDRGIQELRLEFIKGLISHYDKKVIVCWDVLSGHISRMNKFKKGMTYDEYRDKVKSGKLYSFMKHSEYIDIMYWCYINNVKMYGVDSWSIRRSTKSRDKKMQSELIRLSKKHKGVKVVFLTHNTHVSILFAKFPGLSFATHASKVHTWIEDSKVGKSRRVSVMLGTLIKYKTGIFMNETGISDEVVIHDSLIYDSAKREHNYHCVIKLNYGYDYQ